MTVAIDVMLWVVVGALALYGRMRGRILFNEGVREGLIEFVKLLPRICIGVIGAGFVAAALPNDVIIPWVGPDSGLLGAAIATIGGALTPGGPVIGFSIGAAMLKSGAGAPQVVAYTTAWALYALHRLVIYEMPMMPVRMVGLRAAVSLPLPFLAAAFTMLTGLP